MRNNLKAFLLAVTVSCGVSPEEASIEQTEQEIVGGITDNGHPYVVGVGDSNGMFCTGTVISKRTVITAGHCFGGITRVFFGTTGNTAAVVAQEIRHPSFSGNTLANDLAILRLSADAPVQPAPLLRETMANNATFVGPNYTFVGYGANNGVTQQGFGTKRVVTFPIDAVGPANVGGTVGSIDSTQFYYGVPNENTCNGDSGGPAFIVRNRTERHAGVTSFGDQDCVIDGVQGRTDTAQINNFIQARIDQFEGTTDPCRNNGVCDESCNTGGQVRDPDCHENHCGQDGICSFACVSPVDPDCTFGFNLCVSNGMCDPNCATLDPDCSVLCGAEGTCIDTCQNADPDCGAGAVCGNSIEEAGEQCDDGNATNTDACVGQCLDARCGDTFVRTGAEQCDDGNAVNTDACTNICQSARCGDGIVRTGSEQCDDGNATNGDGCSSSCTTENNIDCGNGIVEAGEQCDDANNSNADTCTNACQNARCGDGIIRTGVEQCDDGNATNGDGCSSSCAIENNNPVCGDGVLNPGEQCDDGNVNNNDGCRNTCVLPFCGDQLIDAGEACDDGNEFITDTCLNCVAARCGDGITQDIIEQCDDSNATSGDGCSDTCQDEPPAPIANKCSTSPASNGSSAVFLLLFAFFGLALSRRSRQS